MTNRGFLLQHEHVMLPEKSSAMKQPFQQGLSVWQAESLGRKPLWNSFST